MNVHGRWQQAAQDAGGYVNFLTAEEGDRIPAACGLNYERLRAIKIAYDPENVFHHNQNIAPSAPADRKALGCRGAMVGNSRRWPRHIPLKWMSTVPRLFQALWATSRQSVEPHPRQEEVFYG